MAVKTMRELINRGVINFQNDYLFSTSAVLRSGVQGRADVAVVEALGPSARRAPSSPP
jgi:acyl-CoA hydrolase